MTAIALRPDQLAARDAIQQAWRTHRRVLQQAPTAWGKGTLATVLLSDFAHAGELAVFVAHLEEINADLVQRVRQGTGITPRVLMGSTPEGPADSLVWIVSEQTVARRGINLGRVGLCIRDECHRQASKSALAVSDACGPDALHLGLTATPARGDGAPLDFYERLLPGPRIVDLVAEGIIAPMVSFSPRPSKDIAQDPVEAWPRLPGGRPRPGILFAKDLEHSRVLASRFAAERGWTAVHCDADTPNRDAIIARFDAGEIDILCNKRLFLEGADLRRSEVTMAATRFGHPGAMLQACGRSRRLYPGKERALFIDLTDNYSKHGDPDADRTYSLDGTEGISGAVAGSAQAMRCCQECWAWTRSGAPCQVCRALPLPPPPPVLSRRELVERMHAQQRLEGPAWEAWLAWCEPRLARGKSAQQIAGAWYFDKKRPPSFTVEQVIGHLAKRGKVERADTPSGLFTVGRVALPPTGMAECPKCMAFKVRPLPSAQGDGQWCSGCGWRVVA